ncbi:MAG: 2'-5' RNA ligase family protein [Nanoarchaeota archaeon]|nr:2'-5' RNA ligase family protein [Nanoarchaeota archaeon]MBU1321288.1 2'-5' RNA ligase family protein [Nanoarchaeota archaeon]MBU1597118.1 2'-5' RNA ligase family protein [Nanoarchaeota archaeon]MBU2442139.1 2'-5' RNA ligase family protein [Nanoarchaeota archaeon]
MKLAVDIALIPPNKVLDWIININKNLKQSKDFFFLNKKNFLPHISLVMSVIDSKDLKSIKKALSSLTQKHSKIDICLSDIKVYKRQNVVVSGLKIKKSPELQALHEDILKTLKPFFSYKSNKEMFFPPINSLPNYWQLKLHRILIKKLFSPHLTLGRGTPKKIKLPYTFKTSKLALCHLGKHSTCRKILASVKL